MIEWRCEDKKLTLLVKGIPVCRFRFWRFRVCEGVTRDAWVLRGCHPAMSVRKRAFSWDELPMAIKRIEAVARFVSGSVAA